MYGDSRNHRIPNENVKSGGDASGRELMWNEMRAKIKKMRKKLHHKK